MGKGGFQAELESTTFQVDRQWVRIVPLRVDGLEVTQGIQRYRSFAHLTDPADQGPDNGVRLVANKTMWVRVYVRSGPLATSPPIADVTGTLAVYRRQQGVLWSPVGTLSPAAPGVVTAEAAPSYAAERDDIGATLNFVVPADWVCGHLKLVADVTAPDPEGGTYDASDEEIVNATLHQTLRLAGILISYDGPNMAGTGNLQLGAPTVAGLQATSAWTLKTQPLSAAGYRSAGGFVQTVPLTDPPTNPGGCSPNWLALNQAVLGAKVADGNLAGWVYYGLLPMGIPAGPVGGCESSGVSSGPAGAQQTMGHEIGHGLGIKHAPCGVAGSTVDTTYPTYEPYGMGSIGEYGLDINTGVILDPVTGRDYMSYCAGAWVSLHNHARLINHPMLDPTGVCVDRRFWKDWVDMHLFVPPWEKVGPPWPGGTPPPFESGPYREHVVPASIPVISLIGSIDPEGRVSVRSVARVTARPVVDRGAATDLTAQLVDAAGEILAESPVQALVSQAGCGCGDETGEGRQTRILQAMLPDRGPGAALRIVERGEERWRRDAPKSKPRVEIAGASIARGHLSIAWKCRTATDDPPDVWVRWSADGKLWHGLATELTGIRARLDVSNVPPGKVRFQVLAHDGFHTAEAKTKPLAVPRRRPSVAILHPQEGHRVPAGRTIRLAGSAVDPGGDEIDPEKAVWRIDGEAVGRGLELTVVAPAPGKHTCTLTVRGSGGSTKDQGRFVSLPVEEDREPEAGA